MPYYMEKTMTSIDEKALIAATKAVESPFYIDPMVRKAIKAYLESAKQPEPASNEGVVDEIFTLKELLNLACPYVPRTLMTNDSEMTVYKRIIEILTKPQPPANAQQVTADREALGRVRENVKQMLTEHRLDKSLKEEALSLLDQIISRGEPIG